MALLTIRIETFSDTSCPWCYVGNVTLGGAMETYAARHPEIRFELSWNPFYLSPNAEVSGESGPEPSSSFSSEHPPPRNTRGTCAVSYTSFSST